jgi:hypothetical protein
VRKTVTSDGGRVTARVQGRRITYARLAGLYDEQAGDMARLAVELSREQMRANRLEFLASALAVELRRCAPLSNDSARARHEALVLSEEWRGQ